MYKKKKNSRLEVFSFLLALEKIAKKETKKGFRFFFPLGVKANKSLKDIFFPLGSPVDFLRAPKVSTFQFD